MRQLIQGSYGAAAGMITLNVLIGKITFAQAYLLVFLEMIFYTVNRVVIIDVLKAVDVGGAITLHMFAAYFGIICNFYFKPRRAIIDEFEQGKG